MKKKTYSVSGLMEWVCLIPLGKATLRVTFTGGVLSSYGVTPAKFTTTDAITQHAIEHSPYFKADGTGKIKLDSSIDIPGDDPALAAIKAKAKAERKAAVENVKHDANVGSHDSLDDTSERTMGDKGDTGTEDVGSNATTGYAENITAVSAEEQAEDAGKQAKVVEVSGAADAVDYLNANFGIAKRNLKSKAQIAEAAAQNGVAFHYPDKD